MEIENVKPEDIERKSFEIISEELDKTGVVINGSIPVDKECQKGSLRERIEKNEGQYVIR